MIATLYLPQQSPQAVSTEGLSLPDPTTGFAGVPDQAPALMGCAHELVDVLACGPHYVAYSVFDDEGPVNQVAMAAVTEVSGIVFDTEDEDAVLRGAVLIIKAAK